MSVLQITFVPLLFSRFIWPSCVLQQRQRGVDDKEGGEEQRGEQAHIKTDVTLDLLSAVLLSVSYFSIHTISLCLSCSCFSFTEADVFKEPVVAAVNNVELLAYY